MRGFKILTLCLCSMPLMAWSMTQSISEINQVVTQYVMDYFSSDAAGEVTVDVGRLDSRLTLHACAEALSVSIPDGMTESLRTVKVQCFAPKPWSIYLSVNVKRLLPVLIAKSGLNRKQVLQKSDLILELRNVNMTSRGYFTDIEQVLGQEAKYNINPGSILSPRMIKPALMIRRNDPVILRISKQGLKVEMSGTALGQGAKGDIVNVRNNASKRMVEGRIVAPGVVEINIG